MYDFHSLQWKRYEKLLMNYKIEEKIGSCKYCCTRNVWLASAYKFAIKGLLQRGKVYYKKRQVFKGCYKSVQQQLS